MTKRQRVRIDTLGKNERFTAAYGGHYTADGRSHVGAYFATRADGTETCFAGCAEVELGWNETGWLERGRGAAQ